MGNQVPREYNGKTCCICSCRLAPCSSFSDIETRTVKDVNYYVFNSGEYYRRQGLDFTYECRKCFFEKSRGGRKEVERSKIAVRQFQYEREKCSKLVSM
ncbi:hypothetical protein HOLleu_04164 [Holothuria leucospilota]|uniref:Uncharacterized protein n=1 Tax=Holothuria leucospilota TaxID=206669 RepID=A0A9Q1HKN1_HOLLE|nr:hypothetical protein HOLleu_04164 [Holothuria leucospilota]